MEGLVTKLAEIVRETPSLLEDAEEGLDELVTILVERAAELQREAEEGRKKDHEEKSSVRNSIMQNNALKRTSSKDAMHEEVGVVQGGFSKLVLGSSTQSAIPEEPSSNTPSAAPIPKYMPRSGANRWGGDGENGTPVTLAEGLTRRRSVNFVRAATSRSLSQQNVYADASNLQQFKLGFQRFKKEVISAHQSFFRDLAASQSPKVMVVACCDSRVDPALLLGAGPGDIFIVRNVANLVPPFERQGNYHGTSAALEYAVCSLKVQHIMVIGHKNCGGVQALMQRGKSTEYKTQFVEKWMEIAAQAFERTRLEVGDESFQRQCNYCERESVNVSLSNLLTFPFVKEAVSRKQLELHGWYYDLEEATMDTWQLRYQISDYEVLK